MKFTATLSAQNTNVYVCDIVRRQSAEKWFATCGANGTFGTGTVTFNLSPDDGVTLLPLHSDGTNVNASLTADGTTYISCGNNADNVNNPKLYASIGAATNPSITITVYDNR